MKKLFTLLVTFIFFLSMSKTNAQIITSVHEYNSETSLYEEGNIRGETLNVNAGQTIHVSVHIKEQSKIDFAIATSSLSLELNNSCTFEASNNLDYNYIPETGDIGYTKHIDGSNQTKNREVNVIGQDSKDEIVITNIKIVIPSVIADQTNYILTLTNNLSGTEVNETLLTFRYQKPQINIPVPVNKGCITSTTACTVSVIPNNLEYYVYSGENPKLADNGTDTIKITGSGIINVSNGEVITLRDINNTHADGTSNAVGINTSYFNPLTLSMLR